MDSKHQHIFFTIWVFVAGFFLGGFTAFFLVERADTQWKMSAPVGPCSSPVIIHERQEHH